MEHVYKSYETPESEINRDKPEMNVMLFSSQEQFNYIYVMICSMIDNNPNVTIHLFIVSFKEIVGKEGLSNFIENKGHKITYYVLDSEILLPFVRDKIRTRTGLGGLIRPIAHTFIEKKYDRMLFMDADMVVLGDIFSEFYNLDFEDNYLITPSNYLEYEKYNNLAEDKFNYNAAVKGSYFNSALLVLNLSKLRDEITFEKVLEIFTNEDRIRNEQHILNVLLANKAKYVNREIYHVRWNDVYAHKDDINKFRKNIKLFHYDPIYVPYKPWDILFEDDSYLERIREVPIKPIYSKYRPYIINELTNDFIKIWWDYAKKTPFYDDFYERMCHVREYFFTYIPPMMEVYNKYSNQLESLRNNTNLDEIKKITEIKENGLTWLNAINTYYSLPLYDYSYEEIDYETEDLNKYLYSIAGNTDLVILITSSITSHHIVEKLKIKDKLGLGVSPKENESYLAVIDFGKDIVIEKTGKNLIMQNYSIECGEHESIKIETNEDNQLIYKGFVFEGMKVFLCC